jgi:hypothetical protein
MANALLLFFDGRNVARKGANMKNIFTRALLAALVLVLLAVGQSACGGGYSSPTAPSNMPGQPTPTPRPGY